MTLWRAGVSWASAVPRVYRGGAWSAITGAESAASTSPLAAQVASWRPVTFAGTYDVAADGSKGYLTIAAACAAAVAAGHGINPHARARIRLWPGSYYEKTIGGTLSHFALIGMGSTVEDVRIWHDQGYAGNEGIDPETGLPVGGNIATLTGRSVYVSNLWLDHQNVDPEWHSIRIAGDSGNIGVAKYARYTTMFENVRMTSAYGGWAGKCATDMTVGNIDLVFAGVWFDTPGQPQAVSAVANYLTPTGGIPSRVVYYGCKVTAGYGWTADTTLPYDGHYSDGVTVPGAIPIGLPDFGSGSGDEVWWIESADSEWDIGYGTDYDEPPRAAIAVVKAGVGRNAIYHIDPAVPAPSVGSPPLIVITSSGTIANPTAPYVAAGGQVDRIIPATLPLDITDGASADEWDFYGPDPATGPARLATGEAGQPVTLTAGRIYFVPVPVGAVAVKVGAVGVEASGSGVMAVGTAYTNPATGAPYYTAATYLLRSAESPVGGLDVGLPARWAYPGHGVIWLALAASAAITAVGATVDAGAVVYYADGYTSGSLPSAISSIAHLAEGQPYPLLEAINLHAA